MTSHQQKKGGVLVYRWLIITLVVVILDQLTKQYIAQNFQLYERLEITPFFNLFYVQNFGAAFSFLSDQSGWQRWFLTSVSALISIGIVFWLTRLQSSQQLLIITLTLVLGGAIGNLIDRAMFGYVIDFIDWYVGERHFPAFNIADAAISMGAVLLIIDTFVNPEPENS